VGLLSERAREALAKAVEDQGPAYRNTANAIRSGFSNFWIAPALVAIERALMEGPADE
jgi:hypothetical protein